MGQECFYRENRQEREEKEILLTKRQTADGSELLWRIRPMTQRENEEIWKRCGEEEGRYRQAVVAESVVFPDLKDADLQNSYGAFGAERLLERLLTAGEYACLAAAVEEINEGEDDVCIAYI